MAAENQCYVVEDFLTFPYQPTCFQLRSQSFTSPRRLKEGKSRRRGLQEQSQSFTFNNEGEGSSMSQLKEGTPVRRRLQELLPGEVNREGEGNGWERLQSIRRRLQEKKRMQEKENVVETMTAVELRRAESVRGEGPEEDFEMRQDFEMRRPGRERRQLMRSTSLTAPLSLRPAFPRSSEIFSNC